MKFSYRSIILRNKFKEWKYEEKVRLFSKSEFISKGIKVIGIYLGVRISDTYKDVLKKIAKDIPIYDTKIDNCNQVVKL